MPARRQLPAVTKNRNYPQPVKRLKPRALARTAAAIWTVTATAQMARLNIITYLTAYLDECGRNGGKPLTGKALERFLPWNLSPEDLRTWAQPPPGG